MKNAKSGYITEMHEKSPKDSFLAYAAALEQQQAGNRKKAIKIMELLIHNDPNYAEAYYKLGKIYENTNKIEKAIKYYKLGKKVAINTNDLKCLGEITESLLFLTDEEEPW